jgi:hypothetical protein
MLGTRDLWMHNLHAWLVQTSANRKTVRRLNDNKPLDGSFHGLVIELGENV